MTYTRDDVLAAAETLPENFSIEELRAALESRNDDEAPEVEPEVQA
jgi:hypothetical protein